MLHEKVLSLCLGNIKIYLKENIKNEKVILCKNCKEK